MCLRRIITVDILKQATEDIVCYKCVEVEYEWWAKIKPWILRKLKRFNHYQTYFRGDAIIIGEVFIAKPILSQEDLNKVNLHENCLGRGFIHSFVDKKDAIKFAKIRHYVDVVECIIPKGTYYFEGSNPDHTKGYASTQIKYIKVV